MNYSSTPVKNPAVLARKIVDDELVLVNADNATSLALTNQTAVTVWERVDGKNTIQDIIKEVEHQFQDVPQTVSNDVLDFIDLLTQDGFIGFEWDE